MSILGVFISACGSDSGNGADSDAVAEVETIHSLGACKGANEGVTKYVTSESMNYKCVNGDWKRIESPVKSSTSNASSSSIQGIEFSSSSIQRIESSSSSFTLSVTIVQDSIVDSRDGKVYATVTIGEQTWMAENLNFDYIVNGKSYGSKYLGSIYREEHDGYYDITYKGLRYTIGAAIDSAAVYSEDGKGCGEMSNCLTMCDSEGVCSLGEKVRGICPEGWHLPSYADWEKLVDAVGGNSIAPYVLVSESWVASWWDNRYSESERGMLGAANFHANIDKTTKSLSDETQIIEDYAFYWSTTGKFYKDYGLVFFTFGIYHEKSTIYGDNNYDYCANVRFHGEDSDSFVSIRCIKD